MGVIISLYNRSQITVVLRTKLKYFFFRMNSISKKCQEAKEKYDACFNTWFSEKYLKGQTKDDCAELFKEYQKCVKEAIAEQKIEIWNLDSEYETPESSRRKSKESDNTKKK